MKTSRANARQVKALEELRENYQAILLELQNQNKRLTNIERLLKGKRPAEIIENGEEKEDTHGNETAHESAGRQKTQRA